MWVFRTGVDLQFLDQLTAHLIMRQHSPHRRADHPIRVFDQLVFQRNLFHTARILGMAIIEFACQLGAGHGDFFGVDHNDEVARIHTRGKVRFILTQQQSGDQGRHTPQVLLIGIYQRPVVGNFIGFRIITLLLHGHPLHFSTQPVLRFHKSQNDRSPCQSLQCSIPG